MVLACEEALRVCEGYEEPDACPSCRCTPRGRRPATAPPRRRAGSAITATASTPTGGSTRPRIVPPTSQNQRQIEADLRAVIEANLDLADDRLQWRCEQTIRNYDPCISCATHALKVTIARE